MAKGTQTDTSKSDSASDQDQAAANQATQVQPLPMGKQDSPDKTAADVKSGAEPKINQPPVDANDTLMTTATSLVSHLQTLQAATQHVQAAPTDTDARAVLQEEIDAVRAAVGPAPGQADQGQQFKTLVPTDRSAPIPPDPGPVSAESNVRPDGSPIVDDKYVGPDPNAPLPAPLAEG